jgi:hypothetical protein
MLNALYWLWLGLVRGAPGDRGRVFRPKRHLRRYHRR